MSKIRHQNLAVILQHFIYCENDLIVLVPGTNAAKRFCCFNDDEPECGGDTRSSSYFLLDSRVVG